MSVVILMLLYDIRITKVCSDFDEDALAGALFGGLNDDIELAVGEVGHTVAALRVPLRRSEHFGAFLHVRQAVIKQHKNSRRDFHTDAVTGTKILINPDFHERPVTAR